jgi:hypothetical protein
MMSPADLPLGSDQFVQGVIEYSDFDQTQSTTRIIIPATFGDTAITTAIVDTGSPWCILGPEEVEGVDTSIWESLGARNLVIRGGRFSGNLYRMPVSLEAEEGYGITVEAKVFVPAEWYLPNFIGFEGFLEMIRFAVDPGKNLFYFGPV